MESLVVLRASPALNRSTRCITGTVCPDILIVALFCEFFARSAKTPSRPNRYILPIPCRSWLRFARFRSLWSRHWILQSLLGFDDTLSNGPPGISVIPSGADSLQYEHRTFPRIRDRRSAEMPKSRPVRRFNARPAPSGRLEPIERDEGVAVAGTFGEHRARVAPPRRDRPARSRPDAPARPGRRRRRAPGRTARPGRRSIHRPLV